MIKLNVSKVLSLHKLLVSQTGGGDGVRDFGLLDSALESAYATFDGQELYPSIEEKASRIGYNLMSNHAFVDGNKRIGMLVMLTFLELNGVHIDANDEDIVRIGLGVASGEMGYSQMLDWICDMSEKHKMSEV